jgi:hypothetical protein
MIEQSFVPLLAPRLQALYCRRMIAGFRFIALALKEKALTRFIDRDRFDVSYGTF